ncbi:MAG: CehA/McbA family metallohydrolase [Mycobacteriales bacterium]
MRVLPVTALIAAASTVLVLSAPFHGADALPAPTTASPYTAYVGSLHEHSGYSDGWVGSTPETFYASGKKFGLDFMGGSDHSDFLGVPLSTSAYCFPDPEDPTGRDPQEQVADTAQCPGGDPRNEANALQKWQQTQVDAEAATTGDYTGFRGFEWTSDVYGHIDVFFSKNFANAKVDGYPTPKTFYDWLVRRPELGGGSDGIATFNHPGAKDQLKAVRQQAGLPAEVSKNWNDFAYDPRVDDQMVGLEVFNDVDEYGSTRDTNLYPEGYYAHALDKGWHVAADGAEDLGHRRSDDWGGPGWAKTVILATENTPAALKAAMRDRRFYAVRDGDIRLDFTVDQEVMGSRLNRRAGSPLRVDADVRWPGHSTTLQLVTSKGKVVASGADELKVLRKASADEKYYFLRVLEGTRPVAYSAPVWITSALSAASGEWLSGDLHVHTCYSHDAYCPRGQKGSYFGEGNDTLDTLGLGDSNTDLQEAYTLGGTVAERFAEASLKGLDYLAITDHHSDAHPEDDGSVSVHDPGFGTAGVVGVPGYENSIGGHAQMLGATRVYPAGDQKAAAVNAMADALRADGGLFQANHPADDVGRELTSCDDLHGMMWQYGYDVPVDSVEVWNTNHWLQTPLPASAGNDDAIFWWECLLSRGQHVTATGGGDSHWLSLSAVQGIGNPTTWVFAPERSARGVLAGVKSGHTSISVQTPLAGTTQLFLEADADRDGSYESMMGDTVPAGTPLRVRAVGAPGAGLVRVRANGHDLVTDQPLAPGQSVDLVAPAKGWVWAALYAPDAQAQRKAACDPVVGGSSTLCRYEIGMVAMTSALYVGSGHAAGDSPQIQSPARWQLLL